MAGTTFSRIRTNWRAFGPGSIPHLAEQFVLMDRAALLRDPEQAAERMRRVLAAAGVV